jgi:hypothetical protein
VILGQPVRRLHVAEPPAQHPQPVRVAAELAGQLTVARSAGAPDAFLHVGGQGGQLPVDRRELLAVPVLRTLAAGGEGQADQQGAQQPVHGSPDYVSVLDEFLPRYDVNEVHSITTGAAPADVMDAIRGLTPRDVPLLVVLMAVRSLPALLRRRRLPLRGPLLDGFRTAGFVALREAPGELVLGGVGRFWRPSGGLRRIEAAEFREFAEPGWAKAAFNFEVERVGDRTLVRTETRVATTDDRARRSFGRYWRVVHPGSALIRVAWLRAIRRRAERPRA